MKPSFNLWRNILGEYVSERKRIEFEAHLARLFTAWGHEWEQDKQSSREKDFTEQERSRHAIIRADIQASWSDDERKKRSDGAELEQKLRELELALSSLDREPVRHSTRIVPTDCELRQLEIGYID